MGENKNNNIESKITRLTPEMSSIEESLYKIGEQMKEKMKSTSVPERLRGSAGYKLFITGEELTEEEEAITDLDFEREWAKLMEEEEYRKMYEDAMAEFDAKYEQKENLKKNIIKGSK